MIPWKTILSVLFILFLIIFIAFFIGYNLDYKTSVSLVFHNYESVSTLLVSLIAFLMGFLFSTFIFIAGVTSRFFRQRKLRKIEKSQLKSLNSNKDKSKVVGLPRYDS